ncbi:MAG: MazF family transcriptional regulator [Pseudohongiellaceae bacterium]
MQQEIKRWGNSAAIRLSRSILAQARLDITSPVSVEVRDGKIIIEAARREKPALRLPFSEQELLTGLDARTAHADEAAIPDQEEWGD